MKKTIAFLTASILCCTVICAQKVIKDDHAAARNVKGFHGIEISGGIDLYLTQGREEAVAVSAATDEDRDRIVTKVEDGILKIYDEHSTSNWGIHMGNRKMKAYVSARAIDKLYASGGSDVYAEEGISGTKLAVSLSGGADFKGKVTMQELVLSASGGSDATISGKAGKVTIDASGGSDIHGYELVTDYCTATSSGGSDIHITVNKEIVSHASGGSDLHYKGNASVSSTKSGGSSVKKVS